MTKQVAYPTANVPDRVTAKRTSRALCLTTSICKFTKPTEANRRKTTAAPNNRDQGGTADQNSGSAERNEKIFRSLEMSSSERLHHLCSPQIVQVNDSFNVETVIYDNQRGDLALLHDGESRGREFGGRDGLGVRRHALPGGEIKSIFASFFQQTAKVA